LAEQFVIPYAGQKSHIVAIKSLGMVTLPVVNVNSRLHIASFVIIDNYELVRRLASVLGKEISKYNPRYLMCIEAKSLPLTYAICDYLNVLYRKRKAGINVRYVVVRKTKKVYMKSPYSIRVKSITTKTRQKLFLDRNDLAKLKANAFVLLDDVISTGATVNAVLGLLRKRGLNPSAIFSVLFEGEMDVDKIDYSDKSRVHVFGRIPLYIKRRRT
jgi:adenine phosphoribosyltransferase